MLKEVGITKPADFFKNFDLVKMGVVENKNIELKAHMLVMVIDNISNFILIGFQLVYRGIWKEAINSVLKEEEL